MAPDADAFTFVQIAGHTGVTVTPEDLSDAEAIDILQALRTMTSAMDENQVTLGSRYLFITPTLKGVLDDYSYANPTMSNRVLERFARVTEVPQVHFYTAIDLKSGDTEFGYAKASTGKEINFMVVEKSAVINFDKHVASRVFSPDELEALDSYMMRCCKYGVLINPLFWINRRALLKILRNRKSETFPHGKRCRGIRQHLFVNHRC